MFRFIYVFLLLWVDKIAVDFSCVLRRYVVWALFHFFIPFLRYFRFVL